MIRSALLALLLAPAALAQPAQAVSYGNGCGFMRMIDWGRPVIGSRGTAGVYAIPGTATGRGPVFFTLGYDRQQLGPFPLPMSLTPYGMPGCSLLTSADSGWFAPTYLDPAWPAVGTAAFALDIPNWPGLIGQSVYLQVWAAAYSTPFQTSDGLQWTFGRW